jgi:Kef-type K+ transport system membrane component KefB
MKKVDLNKEYSVPKKIAIDILGVLLIIASGLFGWLPGPGGLPLLFAGLSLLATNHEWARRLLDRLKNEGTKLMDIVFKDHPILVIIYDIVAISLLIAAGIIFGNATGNILRGLATALIFLGIGLFLGNRKRITSLNRFVRKIKRR